MIRTILMAIMVAFAAIAANGEQPKRVRWSADVDVDGSGTGVLRIVADIEPGWHIYGMEMPDLPSTPVPTSIVVENTEDIDLVGGIEPETAAETHVDEVLKLKLPWWEGRVAFVQHFAVKGRQPKLTIRGAATFMAGWEQACSRPTTETFEVSFANPLATAAPAQEAQPKKNDHVVATVEEAEDQPQTAPVAQEDNTARRGVDFGLGVLVGHCITALIVYIRRKRKNKKKK